MNENTINNDVTMAGESERTLLASRYRIIRQLGQGGMGSVWLAEDTQLDGKLFAIKMLPSILVANKRAYNQLKSEALVSMKLTHPNIVTLRAFEENNGNPFLVMDYIEGQTLDDWLGDRGQESGVREVWPGRSPLREAKSLEACERPREPHQESGVSEEEVVRLLKPIAEALDYAHTEGVVHRDIKPANVMIRKDGRPFIMDFGIAREIQETLTRVTGKMSSGTLMYMSPEQLNGDMPKPAQDVYSFAAMVYECLKGEPPFCRGNIEHQIMNKAPEPLTYGRASVLASRDQELGVRGQELGGRASRPVIADSVIAGLAKNPGDRPKCCVKVLGFGDFGSEKSGIKDSNRVDDVKAKHGDVRHNEDNDHSCETLFEKDVGQADMPRANASSPSNVDVVQRVSLIGLIILLGLVGFGLFAVIVWWPQAASNRNRKDVSSDVPPSRPEGPRESDVTGIAYEAAAQSNIIERIDGADGFNSKKDVLSRLLTTAVAYRKKNSWAYAAVTFTNYVEGCKVLITLDGERKIAKEKHSAALASQMQAEKVESSKYASARWGAASDVMKKANEHFSQMEFSEAEGFYESAAKQFELCVGEAKTERERQVKERIRRAKWRKEGASYTIEPDGLNLTMKWCPAGSFMMGSPASEAGRKGDEVLHNVTLTKGYWLGETEVMQGQWKRIMDNETVADLVRKGLYDDALCVWNGSKFVTLRESWNIEQNADPMSRCGDLNDNIPVYNHCYPIAKDFEQ